MRGPAECQHHADAEQPGHKPTKRPWTGRAGAARRTTQKATTGVRTRSSQGINAGLSIAANLLIAVWSGTPRAWNANTNAYTMMTTNKTRKLNAMTAKPPPRTRECVHSPKPTVHAIAAFPVTIRQAPGSVSLLRTGRPSSARTDSVGRCCGAAEAAVATAGGRHDAADRRRVLGEAHGLRCQGHEAAPGLRSG